MNALAERIARLIRFDGPISVAQYMAMAMHDPAQGYYATHEPIGAGGDFITAPEVSQLFGEMLGAWMVQVWRDQNCPAPARLVELGPGRGTLMADALRAMRLDRRLLAGIEVVLVEASARLRAVQAETLKAAPLPVRWLDRFDDSLADRPLLLIANEFFDALPIRQFVFTDRGWCERMIGIAEGKLAFALSPAPAPLDIPPGRGAPAAGAVHEICPSGDAIVEQIGRTIEANGGAALIVDYGSANAGFGETLQAVSRHAHAGVLDDPGDADISAHVDFAAIARVARGSGATTYGPVEQGAFLTALGIVQRAEMLCRQEPRGAKWQGHLSDTPLVRAQLERLIAPEQMGALFKALAVLPPGAPAPPGF